MAIIPYLSTDQVADALNESASSAQSSLVEVAPTASEISGIPSKPGESSGQETNSPDTFHISFFFDGTGNNQAADKPTNEHTNVARLFLAHKNKPSEGVFSHYIEGIGTRFERNDESGWSQGKQAVGKGGQSRLDLAMKKLKECLLLAYSKFNSQQQVTVNVHLFGFSRGAALARAFALSIASHCTLKANVGWQFRHVKGFTPIRIRFMGLFDTVASVGIPMSFNLPGAKILTLSALLDKYSLDLLRTVLNERAEGIGADILFKTPNSLFSVKALAFSSKGVDPAPGANNGHLDWGQFMAIPKMVETCLHLVAGHETRNSFPLECIPSEKAGRRQVVMPGAHADIGGGYRPGEGARGLGLSKGEPNSGPILSTLSLRYMYTEALAAGVPFKTKNPKSSEPSASKDENSLSLDNEKDFAFDGAGSKEFATLLKSYTDYVAELKKLLPADLGEKGRHRLGVVQLAHMKLWYKWRFHKIARNQSARLAGITTEDEAILREREQVWIQANEKLKAQMKAIREKQDSLKTKAKKTKHNIVIRESLKEEANTELDKRLQIDQLKVQHELDSLQKNLALQEAELRELQDKYLQLKTQFDTSPTTDGSSSGLLALYDDRLLADARLLKSFVVLSKNEKLARSKMRPFYSAILNAYEEVYEKKQTPTGIVDFFDKYVHDSLAGFGMDATLPSDPRVLYEGDGSKLKHGYAMNSERKSQLFSTMS